jgi:hypothetical protein
VGVPYAALAHFLQAEAAAARHALRATTAPAATAEVAPPALQGLFKMLARQLVAEVALWAPSKAALQPRDVPRAQQEDTPVAARVLVPVAHPAPFKAPRVRAAVVHAAQGRLPPGLGTRVVRRCQRAGIKDQLEAAGTTLVQQVRTAQLALPGSPLAPLERTALKDLAGHPRLQRVTLAAQALLVSQHALLVHSVLEERARVRVALPVHFKEAPPRLAVTLALWVRTLLAARALVPVAHPAPFKVPRVRAAVVRAAQGRLPPGLGTRVVRRCQRAGIKDQLEAAGTTHVRQVRTAQLALPGSPLVPQDRTALKDLAGPPHVRRALGAQLTPQPAPYALLVVSVLLVRLRVQPVPQVLT